MKTDADKLTAINNAFALLRQSRDLLVRAGARKSADKVRAALRSTAGAQRNRARFAFRSSLA